MRATLSNGMYREVLVHSSTYFLWCKEDQKNISNFTRHYVVKEEGQTKQNKLLGGWISKRENVWADGLASRSQPEASRHLPHQPRSNAAQWLTGRARSGRRRWACTLRCKPRSCQSRILFPATEREREREHRWASFRGFASWATLPSSRTKDSLPPSKASAVLGPMLVINTLQRVGLVSISPNPHFLFLGSTVRAFVRKWFFNVPP